MSFTLEALEPTMTLNNAEHINCQNICNTEDGESQHHVWVKKVVS